MLIKIKTTELKKIREELLKKQKNKCYLCSKKFDLENNPKDCHVHHNHSNGLILCCLCRRCNVMESKWLRAYQRNTKKEYKSFEDFMNITKKLWKLYSIEPTKYIHPTHKPDKTKRKSKKTIKKPKVLRK